MHHVGCPVIALGGADLKRRIDFQRSFPATVLGATARSSRSSWAGRCEAQGLGDLQSGSPA